MDNISANVGRLWQYGAWAIAAALIGLCEHDDDDDEVVESIVSLPESLSVDGGGVGARAILRTSEGGRCDLRPDILLELWIVYSGPHWEPSFALLFSKPTWSVWW